MRVVAKKNGKFKIVGLSRQQLSIIKTVLDYCDDDLIVASLKDEIKGTGLLTKSEYIGIFTDKLFVLLTLALDGDD